MKKILYEKNASSPLSWKDSMVKTDIKVTLHFDWRHGLRFTVKAGNISYCERSLIKAFCECLEHESIGMAKYNELKDDVQEKDFWRHL